MDTQVDYTPLILTGAVALGFIIFALTRGKKTADPKKTTSKVAVVIPDTNPVLVAVVGSGEVMKISEAQKKHMQIKEYKPVEQKKPEKRPTSIFGVRL